MLQRHLCRTSCCYLGLAAPMMHLRQSGAAISNFDCCTPPTCCQSLAWLPAACCLQPATGPYCQVRSRKHAAWCAAVQSVRVSLISDLKQQMQECFRMMDVNGSGTVDPSELGTAFRVSLTLTMGSK